MSTTKYPVDSATCSSCAAIGGHAPGCVGAAAQADGMDTITAEPPTDDLATIICTACGAREAYATDQGDADELLEHRVRREGWILYDEAGHPEPTCQACVDRTKADRARRSCPTWCTSDHCKDELPGTWDFFHAAPVLGVGTWSTPAVGLEVVIGADERALVDTMIGPGDAQERAVAVAQLRSLAHQLLASAAWVEGNR